MQKIFPVNSIREADKYTIENLPIKSIDLMERAGKECFLWLNNIFENNSIIHIFVGPGNNGGDGLVVARLLSETDKNYRINIHYLDFTKHSSPDFNINYQRILAHNLTINHIKEGDSLPNIEEHSFVIDAIFGSGLNKEIKNYVANVIQHINQLNCYRIAIDIPSGLFADNETNPSSIIFKADITLSLQFAKLNMMFADYAQFVGNIVIIPIGLHPDFIEKEACNHFLMDSYQATLLLKSRNKFSHKGNYGHALLIAGSYGMGGAAILSAKACLRCGCGLLSTHVPKSLYAILQISCPESMVSIDESERYFSQIPSLEQFDTIGIGPGLGKNKQSANALKVLIQETKKPMVLDADALNILSENKTWVSFLPPRSILTPHPKEFERLFGKSSSNHSQLQLLKEKAVKYQLIIVLKGAHTATAFPNGNIVFNSSGNPGMATAGSGDVLTGMILSFLTQNYTPENAAILGVYLHGLAGDLAAENLSEPAMIASDIIDCIPDAFLELED